MQVHIFLGHISLPLRSACCDLADAGDDHDEATCDDDDDDGEENNNADDDDGNTIEAWKRRFGSGLVSPPVEFGVIINTMISCSSCSS